MTGAVGLVRQQCPAVMIGRRMIMVMTCPWALGEPPRDRRYPGLQNMAARVQRGRPFEIDAEMSVQLFTPLVEKGDRLVL